MRSKRNGVRVPHGGGFSLKASRTPAFQERSRQASWSCGWQQHGNTQPSESPWGKAHPNKIRAQPLPLGTKGRSEGLLQKVPLASPSCTQTIAEDNPTRCPPAPSPFLFSSSHPGALLPSPLPPHTLHPSGHLGGLSPVPMRPCPRSILPAPRATPSPRPRWHGRRRRRQPRPC